MTMMMMMMMTMTMMMMMMMITMMVPSRSRRKVMQWMLLWRLCCCFCCFCCFCCCFVIIPIPIGFAYNQQTSQLHHHHHHHRSSSSTNDDDNNNQQQQRQEQQQEQQQQDVPTLTCHNNNNKYECANKYLQPFSLQITEFDDGVFFPTMDNDDNVNDDNDDVSSIRDNNSSRRQQPQQQRGIKTIVDRNVGDILLKIPIQDTLSSVKVRTQLLPHIFRSKKSLLFSSGGGGGGGGRTDNNNNKNSNNNDNTHHHHHHHHIPYDEEEVLALGLLYLRDVQKDPYIVNILPTSHHRAVWNMPIQLWESMMMMIMMSGTTTTSTDTTSTDTTTTSSILPRCYRESFEATRRKGMDFVSKVVVSSSEAHNNNNNDKNTHDYYYDYDDDDHYYNWNYTTDDALWAFSMVRSRSVAVPELLGPIETVVASSSSSTTSTTTTTTQTTSSVPLALIPGLDLFNHAFGSGTQMQLIKSNKDNDENNDNDDDDEFGDKDKDNNNNNNNGYGYWLVTTSESYKAGEQVFLSYGDDKDNWKLLLTYGFAVPDNPNSIVFWNWDDMLDAANAVRPTIFTDRVCDQLRNHPQLGAYRTISETRPTFSFDAKHMVVRESLSNGLAMLTNLATQLGHDPNESGSIQSDTLNQLITTRLHDLVVCQIRLKDVREQLVQDGYDDWIPFIDSLSIALQQETRDLSTKPNDATE